jgi:hypothetical protein
MNGAEIFMPSRRSRFQAFVPYVRLPFRISSIAFFRRSVPKNIGPACRSLAAFAIPMPAASNTYNPLYKKIAMGEMI